MNKLFEVLAWISAIILMLSTFAEMFYKFSPQDAKIIHTINIASAIIVWVLVIRWTWCQSHKKRK